MPSTDSLMQPISGPILVPGTQQEPTKPSIPGPIDIGLANGSLHGGSSDVSPTTSNNRTSITSARLSNGGNVSPSSTVYTNQPSYSNNPNSGLRRFASIGGKKLNVENSTLKAKVVELERYVVGMKEELILAHRQIRSLKSEVKTAEERKITEMEEITQHAQKCEYELGAKIVECDALYSQLKDKAIVNHQQEVESVVMDQDNIKMVEYEERIMILELENERKDGVITELLQKVDCLGTEVLNLEREKARLERPASPTPAETSSTAKETNAKSVESTTSTTGHLNDLVPITAEAIIAATTPVATTHKGVSDSPSDSSLETSSTAPSTVESDKQETSQSNGTEDVSTITPVNSVGYDMSREHPKLLVKFQALRIQHAQTSEYLEMLESENQDLKVQLLDI
ncbi:hypothetical protein BGZ76_005615, partial [Entomortierella beljakovae]